MEDRFEYFLENDDCSWKDEEEKLRKQNIIYKGKWCHGFRIIPREDANPLIEMLCEDDGKLFSEGVTFDLHWAKHIVEALQETIKFCEENDLYKWKE